MRGESDRLPSGWEWATLPQVAEVNPSQPERPPSDSERVSFVPMPAVEVQTGRLDASETRPWGEVRKGYTRFQNGDVLFAKITPCMENGKVALAANLNKGIGAGSTEFHVLRPSPAVLGPFLMYYLLQESFRREARARMTGTAGQLRVPTSFLDEARLPIPPLPEQSRILSTLEEQLTRLDAAVATLERVRVNLKRYRASVLKAAVEGRLAPTEAELARREGRSYEPASVLLGRILRERRRRWEMSELAGLKAKGKAPKDDSWKAKYKEPAKPDTSGLPELPEGWCWASIPQLGELGRGKSKHRPRDDARLFGGPYPFLQTGEVSHSDGVISSYRETYSEFGLRQSRLWPRGTLCITIAANIARTGILGFEACFPDSVVGFVNESCPTLVRFIELFIRTARERLERYAPATAQKNINLETLGAVAVPLPPMNEQVRILEVTDDLLSVGDAEARQSHVSSVRLSRLRQSILKWAFEGRLVDQDPNDEPASVFLERVKAERAASAAGKAPSPRQPRRPRTTTAGKPKPKKRPPRKAP